MIKTSRIFAQTVSYDYKRKFLYTYFRQASMFIFRPYRRQHKFHCAIRAKNFFKGPISQVAANEGVCAMQGDIVFIGQACYFLRSGPYEM
jgi:hypothetical protein